MRHTHVEDKERIILLAYLIIYNKYIPHNMYIYRERENILRLRWGGYHQGRPPATARSSFSTNNLYLSSPRDEGITSAGDNRF
jgi:hypothetical protein